MTNQRCKQIVHIMFGLTLLYFIISSLIGHATWGSCIYFSTLTGFGYAITIIMINKEIKKENQEIK